MTGTGRACWRGAQSLWAAVFHIESHVASTSKRSVAGVVYTELGGGKGRGGGGGGGGSKGGGGVAVFARIDIAAIVTLVVESPDERCWVSIHSDDEPYLACC